MTDATTTPQAAGSSAGHNDVGPYKIIGRLGRGGMAEVLLALQNEPVSGVRRLVVIKRVLPELLDEDPRIVQAFLDEARLAARLSHANVVQSFEVGQDGDLPYIAMEFLEGQTVDMLQRRAYAQGQKIPVHIALRIFSDACDGLHYAHELNDFDGKPLNVIHRDVTPSNIFVKYDGTTKIVDFGIAKSATQREKTRAGTLKGKMPYMAPEQFRSPSITRAVDIWATGVVLWETLAGERLFRSKNSFETMQAVSKRPIPKISERRSDVPKEIDEVLAAALERDPAKRIATAEEFKNRLDDVAVVLGKVPRKSDVAKMMQELFAKPMQQNQALIRDFMERSVTMLDAQDNFLHLRSSAGALELEVGSAAQAEERLQDRASQSGELPQPPFKGAAGDSFTALTPPSAVATPTPKPAPVAPSPPPVVESAVVSSPPSSPQLRPSAPVPTEQLAVPSRPLWHWAAMAAALMILAAAMVFLLR